MNSEPNNDDLAWMELLAGRDVDDAIGVDFECHLDGNFASLRHPKSRELELAEHFVFDGLVRLTLEYFNLYPFLVVSCCRKGTHSIDGNWRVLLDNSFAVSADRPKPECKWRDVEEVTFLS